MFRCRFVWQVQGIVHLSNTWGFCTYQLQPPIHYTTLHYITLHHNTLHRTTRHNTPPHHTTPHHTTHHTPHTTHHTPHTTHHTPHTTHHTPHTTHHTPHHTTPHHTTPHDTPHHPTPHPTTPHHTTPHHTTLPHYIQQLWVRWPLQPLQPLQQTQIQPPVGQSVDSLCHPWFTTTNLSEKGFLFWNFTAQGGGTFLVTIASHHLPLMCLKQCHLHHPPAITIFIGGMFSIPSGYHITRPSMAHHHQPITSPAPGSSLLDHQAQPVPVQLQLRVQAADRLPRRDW